MAACINLEALAAEYGMKFVECLPEDQGFEVTDKENIINKALGVLSENGFYAMSVFLLSANRSKDYAGCVFDHLVDMLCDERLSLTSTKKRGIDALEEIRLITENLPRLILARKVAEQALTFARYHCKAKSRLIMG